MVYAILLLFSSLLPGIGDWLTSKQVGMYQPGATYFTYGLLYTLFTYPILLLYGIPCHAILSRLKLTSWRYYALCGFLGGLFGFLGKLNWTFVSDRNYAISFLVMGISVALVFWWLAIPQAQQHAQPDARNNGARRLA